jgi:hypothetical protein
MKVKENNISQPRRGSQGRKNRKVVQDALLRRKG